MIEISGPVAQGTVGPPFSQPVLTLQEGAIGIFFFFNICIYLTVNVPMVVIKIIIVIEPRAFVYIVCLHRLLSQLFLRFRDCTKTNH